MSIFRMETSWNAWVFCFLAAILELGGERVKISDGDSLDMDCDLNKMNNDELMAYGDALYLRTAKAQGASEVVAYLSDLFKDRKEDLPIEEIRNIFGELTKRYIDPAMKTRSRLEALNTLWEQRVNASAWQKHDPNTAKIN